MRFWGAVAVVASAVPHMDQERLDRPQCRDRRSVTRSGCRLAATGAGAAEGLLRGLAAELAPVRVNAIRPEQSAPRYETGSPSHGARWPSPALKTERSFYSYKASIHPRSATSKSAGSKVSRSSGSSSGPTASSMNVIPRLLSR